MAESFNIRVALPEDKDAILGIHNNVYNGSDYLADYYDYWHDHCPNVTSYVYEQDGEIVSFVHFFNLN